MLHLIALFAAYALLSIALAPFMPLIAIGVTLWRGAKPLPSAHALA